jgi:Ala-tRNA(Pro) deacylase
MEISAQKSPLLDSAKQSSRYFSFFCRLSSLARVFPHDSQHATTYPASQPAYHLCSNIPAAFIPGVRCGGLASETLVWDEGTAPAGTRGRLSRQWLLSYVEAIMLASLVEFLDDNNVNYRIISHEKSYTAQGTAARAHVPGQEFAKTVILIVDERTVMAVLPAYAHVDTDAVKAALGAESVRLAREPEIRLRFPDCELGAMPPFGNLYGMAVILDESLSCNRELAFNAGSHEELLILPYEDFVTLLAPRVTSFAAQLQLAATAR